MAWGCPNNRKAKTRQNCPSAPRVFRPCRLIILADATLALRLAKAAHDVAGIRAALQLADVHGLSSAELDGARSECRVDAEVAWVVRLRRLAVALLRRCAGMQWLRTAEGFAAHW